MIAQKNGLNIRKNPDAQYQTYSSYKSNNTLKKLIFCTKSGSISYISEAYAGSCTERFITEDTNIFAKFTPGFMVLFDKDFNVQYLFLSRQVKCVLPPFVRSKRQFTRSEVYTITHNHPGNDAQSPTITHNHP